MREEDRKREYFMILFCNQYLLIITELITILPSPPLNTLRLHYVSTSFAKNLCFSPRRLSPLASRRSSLNYSLQLATVKKRARDHFVRGNIFARWYRLFVRKHERFFYGPVIEHPSSLHRVLHRLVLIVV